MTRFLLLIPACFFLASLTSPNCTLGQSDNSSSQVVALLDVERVFAEDAKLQATMSKIKEAGLQTVEVEQDEDPKAKSKAIQTELLDQEAEAYFDCFSRMSEVVKTIAKKNGITLVMRAKTSSINRHDRAEVINRINSSVIFHHKLDTTNMVIAAMKKQHAEVFTLPAPMQPNLSKPAKRKPKFCDQCGQKLNKGPTDCHCLESEQHADQ